MEIKVISNETEARKVNIFDGDEIYYHEYQFKDKNDFKEQYKKLTGTLTGHVLNTPDDIWKDDLPERNGSFICMNYEKDDVYMFAIIMNSKVYITNKGQTVDTFLI
jgi:hypothetical protein